ncbi:MAG: bifunctional (p)ppGpp synthetase/guanosine-3',5'-bis(diphosphate) 3'-pyrophosphohydrolase [Defluviitaleaceae bacterium]|nr:bifunctional (p)ppGpp synthetase/guanosine-3',5'-bis(diphosphate) 3'-pyrophosphohydrolase [Defluviitaleaceae bacterium]
MGIDSDMPAAAPEQIYYDIIENSKIYNPSMDLSAIKRAYELALKAHAGQTRKSGEAYVNHPLEVAKILTTIEMDSDTIVAAILHDVLEDTDVTYKELEEKFSKGVAALVDGVTKLDSVDETHDGFDTVTSKEDNQANTYRKMIIATANDPRVVIIKIADRLHNMRTIKHMPEEHKKRKATETMYIYAPIAERLGISKLRYELEDLAFRYGEPDAYQDMKEQISKKQNDRYNFIQNLIAKIEEALLANNEQGQVYGRPKHFYSIYKKMKQKDKTLDEIYDLYAVRVIVDSDLRCHYVNGIMSSVFTPVMGRFKDYVSTPKANGYQSIHNTLLFNGEQFEIQIRTQEMEIINELGVAAHWKYKSGGIGGTTEEKEIRWLRSMMDWQQDFSSSKEYLDEIRNDFNPYNGRIYCLTPRGMPVELTEGATPIDFAYEVHSDLGNRMVGAKINGRIVQLGTQLISGDQIEIITSNIPKGPSPDWLRLCKTSKSRAKINAWFRKQKKDDNIILGKRLLEAEAEKHGLSIETLINPAYIENVLERYSFMEWDTLCSAIGHGDISESQVINRLLQSHKKAMSRSGESDEEIIRLVNEAPKKLVRHSNKSGVTIEGLGNMAVRLPNCCNPMPGDGIVGFITRGRGVTVHKSDCNNVLNLDETGRKRLLIIEWDISEDDKTSFFLASLDITAHNRKALLHDITGVFADERIDLNSLSTHRNDTTDVVRVSFYVSGRAKLEILGVKLNNIRGIIEIKRTVG